MPGRFEEMIARSQVVLLSAASIWELSIKIAAGEFPPKPLLNDARTANLTILPVSAEHAEAILSLPRHHRDPFDHMLLAQARVRV